MSVSSTQPAIPLGLSQQGQVTEAYVSLLYGDHYLLPLRVMMRSLLEKNADVAQGRRARVVAVTGDTSSKAEAQLRADGIQVLRISEVVSPYINSTSVHKRFSAVLTKLAVFNLSQYSKVVFVDADALILGDTSALFQCGQFCAAFINPCYFNTGLMVISPKAAVYSDMMQKLPVLESYDGGDQGFLNSYYPRVLSAPMFNPSVVDYNSTSDTTPFKRLSASYHGDHSAFYTNFRWDHSEKRCGLAREVEWLGPPFLKPWLWYTYAFADLSWTWYAYRKMLVNPLPDGERGDLNAAVIMLLCYLVLLASFTPRLRSAVNVLERSTASFRVAVRDCIDPIRPNALSVANVPRRFSVILTVYLGFIAWSLAFGASFLAVPRRISPYLATATFLHVRIAFNWILLAVFLRNIECWMHQRHRGRLQRGVVERDLCTDVTSTRYMSVTYPLLECLWWSVLDGLFLVVCFWAMWRIKFEDWSSRVVYICVSALLQVVLTFQILVRVTRMWMRYSTAISRVVN